MKKQNPAINPTGRTPASSPWGQCVVCRKPILTSYSEIPSPDGVYSIRVHDTCVVPDVGTCIICHGPLIGTLFEVPSCDGELGITVHTGCYLQREAVRGFPALHARLTAGVEAG